MDSPNHSDDFASTDLNFDEVDAAATAKKNAFTTNNADSSVAIVNHGLIVSAKTDTVERVVIPEKNSGCCAIL